MRAEALKGHLDLLLLAVVEDGPQHGYAVIETLRERSDGAFDLSEGTIYPALHRLERAGLVGSSWTTAGGRRRRVYAISPSGSRALAQRRREWTGFTTAVHRVLEGTA